MMDRISWIHLIEQLRMLNAQPVVTCHWLVSFYATQITIRFEIYKDKISYDSPKVLQYWIAWEPSRLDAF